MMILLYIYNHLDLVLYQEIRLLFKTNFISLTQCIFVGTVGIYRDCAPSVCIFCADDAYSIFLYITLSLYMPAVYYYLWNLYTASIYICIRILMRHWFSCIYVICIHFNFIFFYVHACIYVYILYFSQCGCWLFFLFFYMHVYVQYIFFTILYVCAVFSCISLCMCWNFSFFFVLTHIFAHSTFPYIFIVSFCLYMRCWWFLCTLYH